MSTTTYSIWFTTGNPFVDTGQEMMAALAGVDRPEELALDDIKPLIPRLVELYFQEGWNKNSYSIFPNSELNNGNNRSERYSNLLKSWIEIIESSEEHQQNIACAVSGRPAQVYLSRKYLPMSDFVSGNFQSGSQEGTPLNASVALALQFSPLGLAKVGPKMMALPHFSADEAQYRWAEKLVKNVFASESLGAGAIQDAGSFRPENAFFRLVENLLRNHQNTPDSSVTLYLFNNFNQVDYKNATDIHFMPSRVFRFIRSAMGGSAESHWRRIVWRGYVNVKNPEEQDEDETLRKHSNRVYHKLLNNESISAYFVDVKRRRPVAQGDMGWRLFGSYQREVIGMDQRRIDSLRDLGDRIAPLVRDKHRRLLTLERADSRGRLTDVLYRLTKDATTRGQNEPLITFEQLVSDVFPHDTAYSDWREVKYLLLFRIYEQLFDELKDDPAYAGDEDEEGQEVVREQQ